jgi:uncharacterized sporulation protein YeaH/YhbH (DUF444 family)
VTKEESVASKQEVIDMLYERLADPSLTQSEFDDFQNRLTRMLEISD